ncbi:hypothetical protein OOT55_10885 [Marinimicrobium sp. C6131]|uniref:hypothetical protein n=1 Tax=Marinimicrobium sp. C6131 TaxID=3022676 RepID=UPI00223C960D|nr:hypothetical protein [Marinimicrobium sp. C6131]UZJ43156.1 hypothetical protein OOT55_10885 [Marinimicrobium sp. C6131]
MNMKQLATQAGFKQVMGSETTGYVFLSEMTDGRAGRRIYIRPELAPKFAALVSESRENFVLHQLLQLRALAGGLTSYSNQSDASEHKTQIGDVTVTYRISQELRDGMQPGVFISDVNGPLFGRGNLPGLYKVIRRGKNWQIEDQGNAPSSIDTTNASINGLADNLRQAAAETMPPMVENAYGQAGANQTQLYNEGFTHFYYPQSIKINDGEWKTPEQKQSNHQHCASKLARALVDAQNRSRKVQWTIHGAGSNLLKSALQQLQDKKLDQHEVMLMAPGPIVDLLPLMQRTGMNLHSDIMKYSEAEISVSKSRNTLWDASKIASQLRRFGRQHEQKADLIQHQVWKNGFIFVGKTLVNLATLGGSTIAQQALTLPNHGFRNSLASIGKVADNRVNPHLNPHLSRDEMNVQAAKQAGGLANSYKVTFKELIKKVRSA